MRDPLTWSFVASQARGVLLAAAGESRCAPILERCFPPSKTLQCDRAKPACTQCIRSHRECFGYRDQLDLRFADETEHVKSKVLTKNCGRTSTKTDTGVPQSTPILRALSNLVEYQAYCFFVKNYVWPDSNSTRGHLDHIPSLFGASGDELLTVTITAVGMASISSLKNDPHLMAAARKKYISALRVTNAALQNPVSARTDQTLTAVVLLGIFEVRILRYYNVFRIVDSQSLLRA